MNNEQYIDHEVRLRVMKEVHDEKYIDTGRHIDRLESKINLVITLVASGLILPVVLHFLKLV